MQVFSPWSDITALFTTADLAWHTIDLVASDSIPITSQFALLRFEQTGSTQKAYFDFRATGGAIGTAEASASNGYVYGSTIKDIWVPLRNGSFDYRTNFVTNINVYLIAVFNSSESISLDTPVNITPTVPASPAAHPLLDGTWETIDISSYLEGSGAKWAICQVDDYSTGSPSLSAPSFRKPGTTTVDTSATTIASIPRRFWLCLPVSDSGTIEIQGPSVNRTTYPDTTRTIYFIGYIIPGVHNATPLTDDAETHADNGNFETKTASYGAIAVVLLKEHTTVLTQSIRTNGETALGTTRKFDKHISQHCVPVNGSREWQWAVQSDGGARTLNAYVLGYLNNDQSVNESSTVADEIRSDLSTPLIEETFTASDSTGVLTEKSVSESITATDSVNSSRYKVLSEDATFSDTLSFEKILNGIISEEFSAEDTLTGGVEHVGEQGDESIVYVTGIGSGVTGFGGFDSPMNMPSVYIEGSGVGLCGDSSTGSGEVIIEGSGSGPTGYLGSSSGKTIAVAGLGAGLLGAVGSGSGTIVIKGKFDGNGGSRGIVGSGAGTVYVLSSGTNVSYGNYVGVGAGKIFITSNRTLINQTALPTADPAPLVITMNMSNAAVMSSDAQFNSMVIINGVLYGADSNGIHRVYGSDDNGDAISAYIYRKDIDFGTSMRKRMSDIYMLAKMNGSGYVEISSENASGTVSILNDDDIVRGMKADLPRGVKGRVLSYEIGNSDGSSMEISELELIAEASETRRGRQA